MKLHLAKQSGFCFGVKRAIKIAKACATKYNNVCIKGDLVHNENVCKDIESMGIKKVLHLNNLPSSSTIIIKAHGEAKATHEELKNKGLRIIDATCPMVKDIHKKAAGMEKNNYQVVIIGDKNHEETKGILGNISKGIIVENSFEVKKIKNLLNKKIGVVCQSTQNQENVSLVLYELSKYAQEIKFINTICQPTRLRQKEIEKLAQKCNAVLIVGSKKSANTKRLYEVACGKNKNTFWLASGNIDKRSFSKFKSIGIIGGASTPVEIIGRLKEKLK
ncbi:MAG: 4-hydroxy-3-methylbut-2-enyl diphosphate reductase [Candidatus Omnitrophota bacterium]